MLADLLNFTFTNLLLLWMDIETIKWTNISKITIFMIDSVAVSKYEEVLLFQQKLVFNLDV